MFKSRILMFVMALFVWCLLTWPVEWQHLVAGVVVSALVAFMLGDLFVSAPQTLKHPHRYWYFFAIYVPVFLWECLKANIDVAYRVLNPVLPINPGIVKVKTSLKSDAALTFLANSITLTPGTMSVDVDSDNGFLYIHWINVKHTDVEGATKDIVSRFEPILAKIFD